MVISINDASEIPIYQQIRNQIVLGISDGRLAPGEQLPTVRALAEEIGINSMTVSKAYTLLKQEGYIYTDRRSGARVRQEFETNKELSEKIPGTAAPDHFRSESKRHDADRIFRLMQTHL